MNNNFIHNCQNFEATKPRRKLKCVLLSEINWYEKATYDSTIWPSERKQNYGDSEKITGCQRLEEREGWTEHREFSGQWKYSVF